jgi:FixJ family two-component response regulator
MESVGIDAASSRYQSTMDARRAAEHCSVMVFPKDRRAADRSLVSVVDDDESVRESLPDLLWEFGFAACAFSSAEEFLSSEVLGTTQCLVLDIVMPGMSGLDLQQELERRDRKIPIVFITAQKDKAAQDRAFRQGAIRLLLKPFSDTDLLEAVKAGLQRR